MKIGWKKVTVISSAVLIVVVISLFARMIYEDVADLPANKRADLSPLIVYARVETNAASPYMVVTEVWKKTDPKVELLVGTQVPLHWPSGSRVLPEGAIMFFRPGFQAQRGSQPEPWSIQYVYSGRVDNVTVSEFKAALIKPESGGVQAPEQ